MIKVQRANVELDIQECDLEYYMNQGYCQIDNTGKVIKECVPNDTATLKKAWMENKETIERLKQEIAELKSKREPEQSKTKSRKAKTE